MVNRVILVGRLTADPDLKATPKGSFIANLRLATNSYGGRDEEGERKEFTEFHRLVVFGRQAEVAGQLLRKGKLIYTDGRLQTRSWDDAGGQKRYSTEVVVESFQILSPKGAGEAA
ncbi:MAG TPA: single-stranded DNA-binding protein [Candidatus Acidoferrales bacterium]|nr:single-stranded DNA-binding protein [Candidatus Acidoferrales bacterium]